jgi:chromate reductase
MKFIAISGSLRKDSYNTALLNAAAGLLPEDVSMDVVTLHDIPILNPDDLANGFPDQVNQLAVAVKQADALVLGLAEFNYSITASMKNVIDWLSIHPEAPLKRKPIALMSASPSALGGARAQYQCRQMFIYCNSRLLNTPEVMVGNAMNRFNSEGQLSDDETKAMLKQQMQALKDFC